MPELPEVEIIRRTLQEKVSGKKIVGVSVYDPSVLVLNKKRFKDREKVEKFLKKHLIGFQINQILRKGKYLFFSLNNQFDVLFHLKMTGKLSIRDFFNETTDEFKYLRLLISLDSFELLFFDKRKFGYIEVLSKEEKEKKLEMLGKDALLEINSPFVLEEILKKEKRALKKVLLDQTRIAGIGNVYADEILYKAGISPLRPANSLKKAEISRLYKAMKEKLNLGISAGGLTLRDYENPLGEKGKFQEMLEVYRRKDEGCKKCGSRILKTKLSGRSTYFCPSCQR